MPDRPYYEFICFDRGHRWVGDWDDDAAPPCACGSTLVRFRWLDATTSRFLQSLARNLAATAQELRDGLARYRVIVEAR